MGVGSCKLDNKCRNWGKFRDECEEKETSEVFCEFMETGPLQQASSGTETKSAIEALESATDLSKLEFVTCVPMFERLRGHQNETLVEAITCVSFAAGEKIVQSGDRATGVYVVWSGSIAVLRTQSSDDQFETNATLERGDFFGEASFTGCDENATYVAETNTECLFLSQSKINELLPVLTRMSTPRKRRSVVGCHDSMQGAVSEEPQGSVDDASEVGLNSTRQGPKTAEEEAFILEALRNNDNLATLMPSSEKFALDIAKAADKIEIEAGEDVIVEGDTVTDYFYVLEDGQLVVLQLKDDTSAVRASLDASASDGVPRTEMKQLRVMERGASFGELALLYRSPRTATIRSLSKATLWRIGRSVYKEMLQRVAEEHTKEYISYLDALKILADLSLDQKTSIAKVLDKVDYRKGDILFREGDYASAFYILLEGTVQLDKKGVLPRTLNAHLSSLSFQSFGDRTLIEDVPRQTTITVLSESAQCLVLENEDFHELLGPVRHLFDGTRNTRTAAGTRHMRSLDKLDILSSLNQSEKRVVAQALKSQVFKKDDTIFKHGDPPDKWYILIDGTLEAFDGVKYMNIRANRAQDIVCHFGDNSILDHRPRGSTVTVKSDVAEVLTLDSESFDLQLSRLRDVFLRVRAIKRVAHKRVQICMKDLSVISFLAQTSTGHIESYRHKVSDEIFAMKSMHKSLIVKFNLRATVFRERDTWLKANSPFICKLYTLFNEPQYLHFLCEFLPGGQLSDIYARNVFYGLVDQTRFYTAGVCLALEHLHGRRIIHRDVRPENVLLSEFGYPKLTGFALSKEVHGKTFTTCGTSEYMAPEILVGTGHTRAVDWWALGVMVFELMVGQSPFASESPMDVYSNVMRGFAKVNLPQSCRGTVGDFICSQLKREPKDRLVPRPGSTDKLAQHAWFKKIDWHSLKNLTLDPPYKPRVRTSKEFSKSRSLKGSKLQVPNYVDDGTGWDEKFALVTLPTQEVLD